MLPAPAAARKRSTRCPFRQAPWGDDHPDFLRIDAELAPDHHARWLRDAVARLDLAPLRATYANRGSPAHPPEQLLPFVLLLYSQKVLSPAAWAVEARQSDPCKWLLRGLKPCRSVLYDFRDRAAALLDSWHRQLIDWAKAEGVTSAQRGSLDGSFVASLASRHQLMGVRRVDRRLLLLRLLVGRDEQPEQADDAGQRQALEELLGPQGTPPAWVPRSASGRQRVLRRYQRAQQRLADKLRPYQAKKKPSKKDREAVQRLKVSVTDADAALGWDKAGTFRPLYNLPLVQATDAPLTLAFDVLGRNNDDGLLKPMMEKTRAQLGHHLEEVAVDGAFVCVGDAAWCEKEGIIVYAPPGKAEGGKAEAAEAAGGAAGPAAAGEGGKEGAALVPQPPPPGGPDAKGEKFPKEAFRYDGAAKAYHCPQGKRLAEAYRTTEKRASGLELPVVVHRASGQDCQVCPEQKRCTSNPKKGRVVKRYEGEEALERLRQRMGTPAGREAYKQRCRSVELGYADLKEHRGLRVFRCFGIKRARAQAGLVILASNALKIRAALQRRQKALPPPAALQKEPA